MTQRRRFTLRWVIEVFALAAIILIFKNEIAPRVLPDGQAIVPFIGRRFHMLSDWLFLQIISEGKNPYNLSVFNAYGMHVAGIEGFVPVARYNPPWYYVFFALGKYLSPLSFVIITTLASVSAAIYAAMLAFRLFENNTPSLPRVAAATFFFPPLLENVCFGQMSSFLALALVAALYSFKRGRDLSTGFWLALLIAKPQSTYLVSVAIVVALLRNRRWKAVCAYIATIFLLICATWVLFPSIFEYWRTMQISLEWKTFTLATYIRLLLHRITHNFYYWPILAVPLATAACVSAAALHKNLSRAFYFVFLPFLSAMTAPYGWFYDLTILIPANCFVLESALKRKENGDNVPLLIWFTLNGSGFLGLFSVEYLSLWYYPVGMLAAGWCASRAAEDPLLTLLPPALAD